ncbi:MAG: hypothetical protein M1820_001231 [Bogoriella megaspora]|nr:MAG: hypothetical protein M1820_001231 [Bogoriella megaspora]
MASPVAPTSAKKPGQASGVLPISASALQRPSGGRDNHRRMARDQGPRLKVVVRRLPPGLTQNEFETALGEEWKLGGGKVDWMEYRSGKISKDTAKPSRPSRAYLHLTGQAHLGPLGDKVRSTTFQDARNSSKDPALVGPPIVEYAPYTRIPAGRQRRDARQGTIDQDPDFIAFLESLTAPIAKASTLDGDVIAPEKEHVKTTPLIEHIREMKAKKDKAPTAKTSKHGRQSSKDGTGDKSADKKTPQKASKEVAPPPDKKATRPSRAEREKAAKEAVKVLNKEAATAQQAASPITSAASPKPAAPPAAPAAERRRERGNARLAAQMVQRDLGIGGPVNARPRRTPTSPVASPSAAQTPPTAPASTSTEKQTETPNAPRGGRAPRGGHKTQPPLVQTTNPASQSGSAPIKPPTSSTNNTNTNPPPSGPNQQPQKKPPTSPSTPSKPLPVRTTARAPPPSSRTQPTPATSSPSNPQPSTPHAFLKHANPSQGITEPLLHSALSAFGTVKSVEIDKRKGFAYAEFENTEGLAKAMKGSPVKVAEGGVVVLERREREGKNATVGTNGAAGGTAPGGNVAAVASRGRGGFGPRGGRGRGGGGRGGRGGAAQGQGQGQGQGQSGAGASPGPGAVAVEAKEGKGNGLS